MEEKKNRSHKKPVAVIIVVIVIIAAALLIWHFTQQNEDESAGGGAGEVVAWDVDPDMDTAGATGEIQIPGYESMTIAAGETTQTVDIGNPSANNCYFVITIQLEDGTVLFQSDYLEPGQGFETIELTQALEAGEYTAVIQYECYSLEDKSALNGASSEFTLIVK